MASIAETIAYARKVFANDGAEGETVHRLCDEIERLISVENSRPAIRYTLFGYDDLTETERLGLCLLDDDEAKYQLHLYAVDDAGNRVRYVASDGGEPEDQSFLRDWSWVVDELNQAAGNG
jgi:hypothetical protein